MASDRDVAGIRCMQVLEHLSDYLDGEVAPETAARIESHLRGCDWCEQFGREFSEAVRRVRQTLRAADDLDEGARGRLAKRLGERLKS